MSLTNTIKKYRTVGRARLLLAAVAVITAVGAVAAGQGLGGGSQRVHRHRSRADADSIETVRRALQRGSPWLVELAKVSDEQRTQLLQILDRHEPGFRQLDSERSRLVEQFASVPRTNAVNSAEIEQFRTDLRALSGQAIDEGVAQATEAVQILKPEQRARLAALWLAH